MKKKKFTCLFCIVFICTNAFTQSVIKKQFVIGGSLNDDLRAMAPTKDGGGILGGFSQSPVSGDKTQKDRGVVDYWIVKQDSLGNIEWDKTIGGDGSDKLFSVEQTTDAGYILGGASISDKSGEKSGGNGNYGSMDYWVVKTDKKGNIEWDKTIGGSDGDYLFCVRQTTDGGYILGGYSRSDKSRDKTQNNRGVTTYDYWVVKLDKQGNIEWDKTIGGTEDDFLLSLQQTADGGYILGGYSDSNKSGEKTQNSKGGVDYWVVKLDRKGNIEWDKTIGGNFTDYLRDIHQTGDGGYILGGYSYSDRSGDKSENTRGYFDYWVVKINEHGRVQWDKTVGGDLDDELMSLQQTRDGGYILGGGSQSDKSGEKTEDNHNDSYDYWVVKLNDNGKVEWDKTIGGDSYDYLYSIKEANRNTFILGGTSSSGISGDKTEASKGEEDYWVVKLKYKNTEDSEITSVNNYNNSITGKGTFKIYPNPVKNILRISYKGIASFQLINETGKILVTKTIKDEGEMNVSNLHAGSYYLRNNTTGEAKKIMIMK